jgi:hypothetical protein
MHFNHYTNHDFDTFCPLLYVLSRYIPHRFVIGHAIIDISRVSGLSVIGLFIAVALGVCM